MSDSDFTEKPDDPMAIGFAVIAIKLQLIVDELKEIKNRLPPPSEI